MNKRTFHVKHLLLSLCSLLTIESFSQGVLTRRDKPFVYERKYDSSIWRSLQQEKSFQSASALEQEFFYWTNYFRSNPKGFFETIIKEFVSQYPEVSKADVRSLEQDIEKSALSLPMVLSDEGLLKMSRIHASDLVKRGGLISHTSSKGKTFSQRFTEAGRYRCGAENVYIGSFDPLEALIALLIDSGVPDKGHRMNLLDPRFGKMGVSFQSASGKKGLLVQDFACP